MVVIIGGVNELAGLFNQRLGDGRMSVTQRADRDAAAQIEITPAGDVKDVTAGAVAEHDLETTVTRDDVLLEQSLHGGRVVSYDRRR